MHLSNLRPVIIDQTALGEDEPFIRREPFAEQRDLRNPPVFQQMSAELFFSRKDPFPKAGDIEPVSLFRKFGLSRVQSERNDAPVNAIGAVPLRRVFEADVGESAQDLLTGCRLFPGGTVSRFFREDGAAYGSAGGIETKDFRGGREFRRNDAFSLSSSMARTALDRGTYSGTRRESAKSESLTGLER